MPLTEKTYQWEYDGEDPSLAQVREGNGASRPLLE